MSKRQSLSKNRELRRRSAIERQEARSERSPQQQLERLDGMLGKGQGASKERARLGALIADQERGKKEKPKSEKETAKAETGGKKRCAACSEC